MNLFLTEDGVLKLGFYGLITQAECYSIKKECDGVRSFAPEVFNGVYRMECDLWSFGISLMEMMGLTSYVEYENDHLVLKGGHLLPFDKRDIESEDLIGFLENCFWRSGWNVMRLMNVSVMGWKMMDRSYS